MVRDGLRSAIRAGGLGALALGLLSIGGGCGGGSKDGQTTPEIAKAQGSEGSAWAKAKAEGKDKRKSAQLPNNQGGRGYVNRPGI